MRKRNVTKLISILFGLALGVTLAFALAAPAIATATLDQSQTSYTSNFNVSGFSKVAQTFTAGITGNLTEVDLYIGARSGGVGGGTLTTEIQGVASELPNGTVLATADFNLPNILSSYWANITFASPASVTSGTQYAIVCTWSGTTDLDFFYANPGPYSAGKNFIDFGSGWQYLGFDLTFKTYVDQTYVEPTYTVTYDGNGYTGGTVPIDSTAYHSGDTVTVLGNTGSLVKTGYTFAGWNTAADASGTSYDGGGNFTMGTSNVTLYAQWTINTYTVTYDANGATSGSVPVDGNNPYDYNSTVTVLGNSGNLTQTGYTFNNWNTAANGSGTSYAPGDTFSITADTTLYAQWTINTYTVTYDANGATSGSVPVDGNSPYDYNSTVTVLGNSGNLTQTGYTFNNWNTAANGSGTSYAPEDTFSITADTTLYAQWTPNAYPTTVTLAGTKSARLDQKVRLVAKVDVIGSHRVNPTGNVTFYYATSLGGSPTQIDSAVALVRGKATLTTTFQSSGTYYVTASYSGDTDYSPSDSEPFIITIK
jgi:uncharacterized repeat protein (TIGR02543 family)